MKRLLDESTDELTRALLEAGVEHRPPAGNRRQVIIAMGAGGALGLFSSNAVAWLGTTAGKVTAAGVAVGVAGAVLVTAPLLRSPGEDAGRTGASAPPSGAESAVAEPDLAEAVASEAPISTAPASEIAAARQGVGAESQASGAGVGEHGVASAGDRGPTARGPLGAPGVGEPDGVPGVRKAPSAAREREPRRVARKAAGVRRAKAAGGRKARAGAEAAVKPSQRGALPAPPAPEVQRAALDAEVRLVDEMRAAARRDDAEALARLVAAYRAEFPDGQLEREVADFEARLERIDTP